MPGPRIFLRIESIDRSLLTTVRFAVVGAITTALDVLLFTGLVMLSLAPAIANVLSYSTGIVVSYHLNRSWTFRAGRSYVQAVKFGLATLTGLLISTLLVAFLATLIPAPAAKIASVPVVFVWNYLVARLWVFQAERA